MTRMIIATIALGAALVATAPALAQDIASAHVRYDDLNISSAQGQQAFQRRVQAAVVQVCGEVDPRDVGRSALVRSCRNEALAAAADQERLAIATAKSATTLASATSSTFGR